MRCHHCGIRQYSLGTRFCTRCGSEFPDYTSDHYFYGFILIGVGIALILWALNHAPPSGLGELFARAISDPNGYFLEPGELVLVLSGSILAVLGGVVLIVRAVISESKQ